MKKKRRCRVAGRDNRNFSEHKVIKRVEFGLVGSGYSERGGKAGHRYTTVFSLLLLMLVPDTYSSLKYPCICPSIPPLN